MKKISLLILCLITTFCLTGCMGEKSLVIQNAKQGEITRLFKEFAGLNGYIIAYGDDLSGVYRVIVDQYTQDAHYETTGTRNKYDTTHPHDKYDKTDTYDKKENRNEKSSASASERTIYVPARTTNYYYIVNIKQAGNNVIISSECGDSNFNNSCSAYKADKFIKHLRMSGYYIYDPTKVSY